LTVSGGAGATISLGYAEALFSEWTRNTEKGHRDEVENKSFHGYRDIFLPDGGQGRLFRPLWWRTYRYLLLEIETKDAPLTIEDLSGVYTGYPFVRKARLDVDDPDMERILDVGWRTARLCAHETYMDCPYYEQLQYVGDTRIQGLISLYMSGDPRLLRTAIAQIDQSRTAEGATMSRAPTRLQQYIPSFSLFWVGMVHDYWMYVNEPDAVRDWLPGVRAVLSFFARYQKADGSLDRLPWWRIIDATPGWEGGAPRRRRTGLRPRMICCCSRRTSGRPRWRRRWAPRASHESTRPWRGGCARPFAGSTGTLAAGCMPTRRPEPCSRNTPTTLACSPAWSGEMRPAP
jgi:hypothetical protein